MVNTISETVQLWERALAIIESRLDDQHIFDTFFEKSYIYEITSDTMVVVLNSSLAVTLISKKYASLIEEVVLEVSQTNYKIRYIIQDDVKTMKKESSSNFTNNETKFFKESFINSKLTFSNFVVGDSNRDSSQAALLISSNPGKMFNPLFIYADSGLGKTHLLHAVGNYIKANKPTAKIVCITADDFINEYISMIKGEQDSRALRDYCKDCDVFLFDDIQFIADKKKTQEMFYYVFNDLVKLEKQIVITSDRPPHELQNMEERLVTRFSSGLTVTIKEPDQATCLAILKKKIEANNLTHLVWDDLALNLLANKFNKTVRELEGALNKVVYHTVLKSTNHVTMELVVEAISTFGVGKYLESEISEQKIISLVADYYNLTPSVITGNSHNRQIVLARHVAMYLIRACLDSPLKKIGQAFGGKDHTTVMAGVQNVEKMLKTDEQMKEVIKLLKSKIKK